MLLRSIVILLVGAFWCFSPSLSHAAGKPAQAGKDLDRFVLHYVQALAHSQIDTWATSDLGCLNQARGTAGNTISRLTTEMARRCWDETLQGHTAMVMQQAESGVFNATGRGIGLGLLHDRHRATENWKEYPPAVFVSPPIILKDHAPIPQTTVVRTSPMRPITLSHIKGSELVSLQSQAVDVRILYPDPLTAPLALRPEEIWWVNGAQRRFGPVREVVARFVVISGLRKFGFRPS